MDIAYNVPNSGFEELQTELYTEVTGLPIISVDLTIGREIQRQLALLSQKMENY